MTAAFKHRLLGTAILVMAGIIFLPDLLDGEKQVVKDDFKVIPDRPEFKGVAQQQVIDDSELQQLQRDMAEQPVDIAPSDADEQGNAAAVDNNDADALPAQQYAEVTATPATAAKAGTSEKVPARQIQPEPELAGWVVRVGSFSKVQNANALVAKLRQAGFSTFTRDITNTQGIKLTSVLVGPELKKEKLEQLLPKLQQLTGIGRLSVMSYQPSENN